MSKDHAARHWIDMGARNPDAATALVTGMLYRSWGLAAVRAQASLKLGGLAHVGSGAAHASRRRTAASSWHRHIREAYQLHHAGLRCSGAQGR